MRYAILTAVSSKQQATPEKVSLQEQETRCRTHCNLKGWHETVGPFIIAGHPRTGYVNLRDAERDMPAIRAALDAAQSGQYDLLAIYDFTRLRDLMTMIFDTLVGYRTQLYPVTQAIEPVPPDEYDASVADAVMFLLAGSSMASRAEINALRKRRKLGMPGRVKRGLAPGRIPYGYAKPPGQEHNRQAVPLPLPDVAAALTEAKDMFLRGASTPQIAEHLTKNKIPTARGKTTWHPDSLRYILCNPYYAGIITYGTRRRQLDYRQRKYHVLLNDPSKIIQAKGAHTPLWDEADHQRMRAEFGERGKAYTGRKVSRFSRLLYCSCGEMLWVSYSSWKDNPPSEHNRKFFCSSDRKRKTRAGHTFLWERDLIDPIADKITAALRDLDTLILPAPEDNRPELQAAIDGLQQRKENLVTALEMGTLDATTYGTRVASLDERLATLAKDKRNIENKLRQTDHRIDALSQLAQTIEAVPGYIRHAPPQQVNASLRSILKKITVHQDGNLQLHF